MFLIQEGYANNHTFEKKTWSNVKSGFTHFAENDIGVAKITPCFENKKSVIFRNLTNGFGAGTTELHIIRSIDDGICPEYVLWFIKTDSFISNGVNAFSGAVGQKRIGKDFVEKYLIPIAPTTEQKRIVERISTAFKFIDEIDASKEAFKLDVEIIKSKILDLAIRGKLVPQDPNDEPASVLLKRIRAEKEELIKQGKIKRDKKESVIFKGEDNSYYEKIGSDVCCIDEELPFEVPENWRWLRLENGCSKEIKRGKSPKYSDTGNTLVFAQKCNTKYDGINIDLALYLDETTLNKYPDDEYMQDGDTVINSTGTGTLGRVGIYKQLDNKKNTPIVPDSHVTVIRAYKFINSDYIFTFLKAIQSELEELGEGSTNQKELKPLTLKQLFIPLPPIQEQERIMCLIVTLFDNLDQIEKSLS